MASFGFFSDPGLTTPFAGSLDFAQESTGSTGAVVKTLYFGSAASGRVVRAASNPGVDSIVLSIVNGTPGLGSPVSDVTIGLEETFFSRLPGLPLSLGTVVNSGVGNAIPIYVRMQDSTGVLGINANISLLMTTLEET